jgi:protoporphyrinogen oxidase
MTESTKSTGGTLFARAAERPPQLTILGGGPAGLAAGHFARKRGLTFVVFEAAARAGGNAVTFQEGPFRFDSGAHRFHDRDPAMTNEVRSLLGSDLLECSIPSQIFHEGRWVDFPLSPVNLARALGPVAFARASASLLRARLASSEAPDNFESFARHKYGPDIARRFLLGYSEKLWGLPCSQLSPAISGARLRGLSLTTFVLEAMRRPADVTRHLDGRFYYPRLGFGMIADKLAESCGPEGLRTSARVTRIVHDGARVQAVEINGRETVAVDGVCCTLPLPVTAALLSPALPDSLLGDARRLRFRSLLLVALFLNRSSATHCGSVYFPDADCPMTRVYEPKNRSAAMAPPDRTMLVAEVPCDASHPLWRGSDGDVIARVTQKLGPCGWFTPDEIEGGTVKRIAAAYPVLETGAEERAAAVLAELGRFENLHVIGRNGLFSYAHTHQMMRFGFEAAARIAAGRTSRPSLP